MDAIAVKLDGTAAAAPTVARRRAALFSALQYAVELELLPNNPLKQLKLRRPIVAEAVDRRVVVNHTQAKTLLAAVRSTHPSLEAYFACLYYSALRPAEARHLRVKDCALPDSGWGELVLLGSTPDAGGDWTDSGEANDDRQLKPWRQRYAPGARVAGTRRDPSPAHRDLSYEPGWPPVRHPSCCSHRRGVRLAAGQAPVRLAPAVSTWLNAGVPPTQVAEWAGHSVNVLLRVYAKCVYDQDEVARQRIEAALALTAALGEPDMAGESDMAETSHRIPTQQP